MVSSDTKRPRELPRDERVPESDAHAARDAEVILRGLVSALPARAFHVGPDLRIRRTNPAGLPVADARRAGASIEDAFSHDEAPRVRRCVEGVLSSGKLDRCSVRHALGGTHDAILVLPLDDRDGSRTALVLILETGDQKATEAFRENEELLHLALDASGLGLWAWDIESGIVTWNARMHAITGLDEAVEVESYRERLVHPADRELIGQASRLVLETGSWQSPPHRILRPDGAVRWVMAFGRMLKDDQGNPVRVLGGSIDVTEQRLLEERLRQTQRLETVGQLAAGIAHNLNNMLAAIVPALEVVRPALPASLHGIVDPASEAARRATELVRELLRFAGQRPAGDRKHERAATLVLRSVALCRSVFERRVVLEEIDESGGALVRGHILDLEQTVTNILVNAHDAVLAATGREPRIVVRIDVVPESALPARSPGEARHDRFVRIRVQDNGIGMPESVRRRIFEPFFTTKEVGRGTGLGLATAYATMAEHEGVITCASVPGEGSTFDLFVPVAAESARASYTMRATGRRAVRGEHVLLVDEEAGVRLATAIILERAGFRVTQASTTADALGAAETATDVRLVLLDRTSPSGAEALGKKLRELLPEARLVFYTSEEVGGEAARFADAILLKPATRDELVATLASLLTPASGSRPR